MSVKVLSQNVPILDRWFERGVVMPYPLMEGFRLLRYTELHCGSH